ncbi:MAG: hypothetical protein J6H31_15130 [Butyrivibrio sp.]|nr:hypothetical protein [Butyrivibrio sp.]
MKKIIIAEILEFLQCDGQDVDFIGDEKIVINEIANIKELTDNSISWIKKESFMTDDVKDSLLKHHDILIIAPFPVHNANTIITENPKHTFFSILNKFMARARQKGIHPTATIETTDVGKEVSIGANCYIGPDVKIGNNVIVHHNVVIECPCVIGDYTEIFSGVVIGTEGYGYYKDGDVPIREQHYKGVRIGSHVDIGANTCIDRGLLGDTIIANNVKIDNGCHIAHNVVIDDNCMVIAGTILCGSSILERNSYMAPGSILLNQKKVEHDAMVGLGSVVVRNVKANKMVFGCPAKVIHENY